MTNPLENNQADWSHKEARHNFAKKLFSTKDKEKRQELYATMQMGGKRGKYHKYLEAAKKHQLEKEELKNSKEKILDLIAKEKSANDNLGFAHFYEKLFTYEDKKKADKKELPRELYQKIYESKNPIVDEPLIPTTIRRKEIYGKPLVDLGCGGPHSTHHMYRLALRYGAKEYIGVDKYPETDLNDKYGGGYKEAGEINFKKQREKEKKIKKIPSAEVIKCDMLEFLAKRTATSNFVMNGIDSTILENGEYIQELIKHINRLTLPGNIVFGQNNNFLRKLEKHGFEMIYGEEGDSGGLKIRKKVA